ncbi:hypothetical protein ACVIHI_004938 [Bradyrhizobium sp. USDA 4524]|nr:hypothetical protein [Bradyrhizobium sp. USDA 4538]MCP1902707.1 hypothetical protein [Bradyrhizobium sp. USDA 4537]MCP1991636.1 hypothetical protein [Bradyrhizobium sp. USDA 4539]
MLTMASDQTVSCRPEYNPFLPTHPFKILMDGQESIFI